MQNPASANYTVLSISGTTITSLVSPTAMPLSSTGYIAYYDANTMLSVGYAAELNRLKYVNAGTSSATLSTVAKTPPFNFYYYGANVYSDGVTGCILDGTYVLRGMYDPITFYPQIYLIKLL